VPHLLGANTVASRSWATSNAVPDCSALQIDATLGVDLIHEGRNVLPCVRFTGYVKLTVLELLWQTMLRSVSPCAWQADNRDTAVHPNVRCSGGKLRVEPGSH
jgi:hypothetical protein